MTFNTLSLVLGIVSAFCILEGLYAELCDSNPQTHPGDALGRKPMAKTRSLSKSWLNVFLITSPNLRHQPPKGYEPISINCPRSNTYFWGFGHTKVDRSQRLAKVDLSTPLPELFGSLAWTEDPDANLHDSLVYLRGCSKLAIPDEFRPFLPTEWMDGQ